MTGQNLRKRIIREARAWIGTPYLHQASVRKAGADCLGLVRGIWRNLYGIEPQQVPNYSPDWGETGETQPLLNAARKWFEELEPGDEKAGDLVLFQWKRSRITKHAGILVTAERFVHAYEKAGVVETGLGSHWRGCITARFRFPDFDSLRN